MLLNRMPEKRTTNRQKKILMAVCMVVLILLCFVVSTGNPAVPAMGFVEGSAAETSGAPASVSKDPALSGLAFSEIMSANRSAVPDSNGDFSDWIELVNEGKAPVSLNNVGLSDDASSIKFLFPNMTLQAGERVVVYASGSSSADPAAPHAPFKISSSGETLYLFDSNGTVALQLDVPALDSDSVYANVNGSWTVTDRYTAGFPNTDSGYDAYRAAGSVENSVLVLNEIMAVNRSVIQDEDGEYVDWIELRNRSGSTIALGGFGLSDDEAQRMKWQFPKGATIGPYGYLVVYASGKNRDGTNGQGLHTNFKIDATRETIVLSNARGQLLDRVVVEGLDKDQSMARHAVTGAWQVQNQATPGFSNDRDGAAASDAKLRSTNPMGLFISEVVTFSAGMDTPYGKTSYDWIEIVNLNQFPVSLRDYGLSDNPGRPRKWQFPDVTLQSGQYLLVVASGLTEAPKGSTALHAPFRLSALGETLVLSDPQGKILDRMVVPQIEANSSYGRNIGQTGFY
ncbi:MAG TPA: lamin tail domain-containing protein, partial [Clostridia bacterium]|nr:lamin tail domain-containing protein [Clostridia bacterium]